MNGDEVGLFDRGSRKLRKKVNNHVKLEKGKKWQKKDRNKQTVSGCQKAT